MTKQLVPADSATIVGVPGNIELLLFFRRTIGQAFSEKIIAVIDSLIVFNLYYMFQLVFATPVDAAKKGRRCGYTSVSTKFTVCIHFQN